MSRRTSLIWQIQKKELETIINKSDTLREVLNHFGLENKGGNYKTLKRRLEEDNISVESLMQRSKKKTSAMIRQASLSEKVPLAKILTKNSRYNRYHLKIRLVEENILPYECSKCGNLGEWEGSKLTLQLDHLNGDPFDNRLSNLTFLCPNCHSQTDTFAGRNKKLKKKEIVRCVDCGEVIGKGTKTGKCPKCYSKSRRKVFRPGLDTLLEDVKELGYCATGRKYGVSDNAIRKWISNYYKKEKS